MDIKQGGINVFVFLKNILGKDFWFIAVSGFRELLSLNSIYYMLKAKTIG